MYIQLKAKHLDMVIICLIILFFLIFITYKRSQKMYILAYWQSGLIVYNRKGQQLIQIPTAYVKKAVIKVNKIIIPYHQETWIIEKNKNDNLKEIEQMLSYLKKATHFEPLLKNKSCAFLYKIISLYGFKSSSSNILRS